VETWTIEDEVTDFCYHEEMSEIVVGPDKSVTGNLERVQRDQRVAPTMGQFAVGVRRQRSRARFSDIVGPEVAARLNEADRAVSENVPRPFPRRGFPVRFR